MRNSSGSARRRDYLEAMLQTLCIEIGIRDSGSEADGRAAELIRLRLAESCDRTEVETFPFKRWLLAAPARLTLGSEEIECYPYYGSVGTPDGGPSGIVRRAAADDDELSTLDARLLHDREERPRAILVPGPFGPAVPRFSSRLAERGVPIVGVSRESLARFATAEANGVQARLELSTRTIGEARTANVVGTIAGTSDDEILLIAHRDTQYTSPGANDNAASLAVMLLLAEHLSRSKPRHTFTFLASGAEEIGCLGARAYADRRRNNGTLSRIALCLNFDSLTYGRHPQIYSPDSSAAEALARRFPMNDPGSRPRIFSEADTLDGAPFAEAGIPTIYLNSRGDEGSKLLLWHRPEDLPATVDMEVAEIFFRSIAGFLEEIEDAAS